MCKCGNQTNMRCLSKSCKRCCSNSKCVVHTQIFCLECNDKRFSKQCTDFKCSECCSNKKCADNCHRSKYLKCTCGIKKFDAMCVDTKCYSCCQNDTCIKHKEKFNKCLKCLINKYTCGFKYCYTCCENDSCSTHNILCSCGNKINKKCEFKKCNGCCANIKCHEHYIQDYCLTTSILNNYKLELFKLKYKLPVEIINAIIDDYADARLRCDCCGYKINLENDFSNGYVVKCNGCDVWLCEHLYGNCSKSYYDGCKIYNYCLDCYDDESNSCTETESETESETETESDNELTISVL